MNKPSFRFEEKLWKDFSVVIGVDEVGRGALAGPVVTAAVAFFQKQTFPVRIDDSKKLKPKERETGAKWIKKEVLSWGIGTSGVAAINKYGIVKATEKAFRQAIRNLRQKTGSGKIYLLSDAFHVKYVRGIGLANQKAIVRGDQKSISIAAASIIAKVHRDRLMQKYAKNKKYYKYGFAKNKGYGTKKHIEILRQYGASDLHRTLYLRKIITGQLVAKL